MSRAPATAWRMRLVILSVAGLLAASSSAQGYDPDEPSNLEVSSAPGAGPITLRWRVPATAPDDYIVRRCTLAALRGAPFGAPYFGNCVATGVLPTTWTEPSPAGTVFYLVSGTSAGVEGSLGNSWNGQGFVPRPPTDCGSPETPQPLTLVVSLATPQLICGTEFGVSFAAEDLTFVSASCTGVQAGFIGAANGTVPGRVLSSCASATGRVGSGEIMRLDFQRADCPVGVAGFHVTRCLVLVGDPDCGSTRAEIQTCILAVP